MHLKSCDVLLNFIQQMTESKSLIEARGKLEILCIIETHSLFKQIILNQWLLMKLKEKS